MKSKNKLKSDLTKIENKFNKMKTALINKGYDGELKSVNVDGYSPGDDFDTISSKMKTAQKLLELMRKETYRFNVTLGVS